MKLKTILEDLDILKPSRSPEERQKNWIVTVQKQIQNYIKGGCVGNLDLRETPIQRLPDNLKKVGGNLHLSLSKIQELPDDLVVNGDLWLNDTPIERLPKNLKVGGDLWLSRSKIQELPDGLVVKGNLWLDKTPISEKYSKEEVRKMVPGVKGNVIIKLY